MRDSVSSATFSTCPNSSSTGVGRPKIDTATLSRDALLVDFLDLPWNEANGPSDNLDLLADLEGDRRLRPLDAFLHLIEDAHGLILGDRHRLVVGAEEARHLRRVLDQQERGDPSSPS